MYYCSGFYPRGGGEVVLDTKPISCLRSIELLDRGNIVQVTGRAFVAGTLPVKVYPDNTFSLCLVVLLIVELCSSGSVCN